MRRIFWGFCRNWFLMNPLHYPFRPFRFWFRIRGDIRIRKTTPRYHRYRESPTPVSLSRGVDDSPHHWYAESHHWYAESATPRITHTESRLLNFLKENSLYRWYGKSSTPRTSDTVSRRLSVSLSRRVADSAITDTESRRHSVSLSRGVDDSAYLGVTILKKKLV